MFCSALLQQETTCLLPIADSGQGPPQQVTLIQVSRTRILCDLPNSDSTNDSNNHITSAMVRTPLTASRIARFIALSLARKRKQPFMYFIR